MKSTIILSFAALSAFFVAAFPSASASIITDSATHDDLFNLDNFLGYYCSIPGKCVGENSLVDESVTIAARNPWQWNYCKMHGSPCSQKMKRTEEAHLEARSFWHWNYCKFRGQACMKKRELGEDGYVEGFPGKEALAESATKREKELVEKYKKIADLLFSSA